MKRGNSLQIYWWENKEQLKFPTMTQLLHSQKGTSTLMSSTVSITDLTEWRNRLLLPYLTEVYDRFNISDRSVATAASGVLQNISLLIRKTDRSKQSLKS